MNEVLIILACAVLFFVLSLFFFNGKGKWLIAGYNTMSKEEKKQYDEKKLCKAMGALCIVCCIMLCVLSYLEYRVNSGLMNENNMFWFGVLFVVVIITTLVLVIRYTNTKAKK